MTARLAAGPANQGGVSKRTQLFNPTRCSTVRNNKSGLQDCSLEGFNKRNATKSCKRCCFFIKTSSGPAG